MLFERLLRGLGVEVDAGRVVDLTQALGMIDIGQKADFYFTLRGLLVLRKEDLALFDRAFELFWRSPAFEAVAQAQVGASAVQGGASGSRSSPRRWRRPEAEPPAAPG